VKNSTVALNGIVGLTAVAALSFAWATRDHRQQSIDVNAIRSSPVHILPPEPEVKPSLQLQPKAAFNEKIPRTQHSQYRLHPQNEELTREVVGKIARDPVAAEMLGSFIDRGGSMFTLNDGRFRPSAQFEHLDGDKDREEILQIYLNARYRNKGLAASGAHELQHYDQERKGLSIPGGMFSEKPDLINNYTFIAYAYADTICEAAAQAFSTDFAYHLFLDGDSEELNALLNATEEIKKAENLPTLEPVYRERSTRAYLKSLYGKALPTDFTVQQLKQLPQPKLDKTTLGKARAAAFAEWYTKPDPVLGYIADASWSYTSALMAIGQDPKESRIHVIGSGAARNVGNIKFEDIDIKPYLEIGGDNYAEFLPEIFKRPEIITRHMDKSFLELDKKYNHAIEAYNNDGTLPVSVFDFDPEYDVLVTRGEAEEYKAFAFKNNVDPVNYFAAKKAGLLGQIKSYADAGGQSATLLNVTDYMQLKKQGLLPVSPVSIEQNPVCSSRLSAPCNFFMTLLDQQDPRLAVYGQKIIAGIGDIQKFGQKGESQDYDLIASNFMEDLVRVAAGLQKNLRTYAEYGDENYNRDVYDEYAAWVKPLVTEIQKIKTSAPVLEQSLQ
jgi:hypothetical protein